MKKGFNKEQEKKFQIKRTAYGLGLFAKVPLQRGDFVIEYSGEKISNAEADRRGGRYLMKYDRYSTIDARGRENLARYMNHSCRPNCVAYVEEGKINIYARKKITTGEELTYDYGKEYCEAFIDPCQCDVCVSLG